MSDAIKHECAVTLLRLLKPPAWYCEKYRTVDYGGTKLSLLLEKQHNRGQDGAGAAALCLDPEPGTPAFRVLKSVAENPLTDLLGQIARRPATTESVFLGHLRYATYGRHELGFCHPFVHKSSCLGRTLLLAGNFNLTNTHELFEAYRRLGHYPDSKADGYLITQMIAHCLGEASDRNEPFRFETVLAKALTGMDGAYTLCGMTADGLSFAVRDPHGIRPGYYYATDEAVVVASERPAIQAAFDCSTDDVKELPPGKALIISPDGGVALRDCLPPAEKKSCVFERVYFSRGNDAAIHHERKALGAALAQPLIDAVNADFRHTVFSYIPNSAQVSFHGLLEALFSKGLACGECVRFGQIAVKDAKFRTFIADAAARREFYKHVYDITYGIVKPGVDTLVVLDDSIVRGNTMKNAILPMLDRLDPVRIIVASSAPPILYPDCYGIDMSTLGELVAFRALVNLLAARGESESLDAAIAAARHDLKTGSSRVNHLAPLYARFTADEMSSAIAKLLTPEGLRAKVTVVFQTLDGLRASCPDNAGDWYFSGDYPTTGGVTVLNRALVNYADKCDGRTY